MTIKIALKGNILNSQPIPEKFSLSPITADINLKSKPVNGSGFDDVSLGFSALIERQVGIEQDSEDKILFGGNSPAADEASCDPNRAELIMVSRPFTSNVSGSLAIKKFEATLDIEDYLKIVSDLQADSTISADLTSRENAALSQKNTTANNLGELGKIFDYKQDFVDGTNFLINQVSFHESSRTILNELPSKYVAYSGTRTLDISRTLPEISRNILTAGVSNYNSLQTLLKKLADPGSSEYGVYNLVKSESPEALFSVSNLLTYLSSYGDFNEKISNFIGGSYAPVPPNFSAAESLINDPNGNLENRLKTITEMLSYEILTSNGLSIEDESISEFKSKNFPVNNISSIVAEAGDPGSYFKSVEGYEPHEASGANSLIDDALKASDTTLQNLERFTDGISTSWGDYLDSIKELRFPEKYNQFSSTGIIIDIVNRIFCPNTPDYKNIGIVGSALRNVDNCPNPYPNTSTTLYKDMETLSAVSIRSFLFRLFSGELSGIEDEYAFSGIPSQIQGNYANVKIGNFVLSYIWDLLDSGSDDVGNFLEPKVITDEYFENKIQNSILYSQIEEFYQNIVGNLSIYNTNTGKTKASGLSEPTVRFLCFELAMTICALFDSVQIVTGPEGIGASGAILDIDDAGVIKETNKGKLEDYKISHIIPYQDQIDSFREVGNFGSLQRDNIVNSLKDGYTINDYDANGNYIGTKEISNALKSVLLWLTEREEYVRERYSLARYYLDNYINLASVLYDGIEANLAISSFFQSAPDKIGSLSKDTISGAQLLAELSRYPLKLDFRNVEPRYSANLLQLFSNFLNTAVSSADESLADYVKSYETSQITSQMGSMPSQTAAVTENYVTENYVIAAVGMPAMTKYNLVTNSSANTGYSITVTDESSFVDISISKKDTQFSELEFSKMSFSFYPYIHCVALPQEDYDNLESTLESLLFFKYEEDSWICCSKSDATGFLSSRTGLLGSDADKIIKNHMVDAICKSAMRILGGVSVDEMLPKYSIPKMSQAGFDLFAKILALPQASKYISPRGLQLGDFMRQVDGQYEFIPFSELDPRIVARTDEPTHRLLQILVTDPVFNYENYYSEFENIPSFERVYFVLFDPEEFYIVEEVAGFQKEILDLLELDGLVVESTFQVPVEGMLASNLVTRKILADLGPGSTTTKLDISEYSATVYLKNTKFTQE